MKKLLALCLSLLLALSAFAALAEAGAEQPYSLEIEAAPVEDAVEADELETLPSEEEEIDLWTDEMAEAEVMAPAAPEAPEEADDEIYVPKSASKTNLVNLVDTELLDTDEVRVTVHLNTAYAGLGRTKWYVYAIEGEKDPVVESFDDAGINTNTDYVMKATFTPGAAVLFGAYTDVTARDSWTNTSDYLELMNNAAENVVEIPAKSTDPKDLAETVTFDGNDVVYDKTLTFENGKYQYIKLEIKQDAVIETSKFEGSGIENAALADNQVLGNIYPVDDKPEGEFNRNVNQGGSTTLPKGTYWMRVYFYWYGDSYAPNLKMNLAFKLRKGVNNYTIKFTSKEVKDLSKAISINKTLHITATIEPKNADAMFYYATAALYTDGGTEEKISDDRKTLEFTAKAGLSGTLTTVTVATQNVYSNVIDYFDLNLAVPPAKPDLKTTTIYSNNNTITIDGGYYDYTAAEYTSFRAWVKDGKKWKVVLDEPLSSKGAYSNKHYITKLKPTKSYKIKFVYYLKNGTFEMPSKAVTVTVKTGVKKAPVIQSAKIANKKKIKGSWIDGYWEKISSKYRWVKGHYATSYEYDVVVTLKNAPPCRSYRPEIWRA